MFRLVVDVNEINIDQVKLPKIPGIGMITRLPNDQKFSMLVTVLNSKKQNFFQRLKKLSQKNGAMYVSLIFSLKCRQTEAVTSVFALMFPTLIMTAPSIQFFQESCSHPMFVPFLAKIIPALYPLRILSVICMKRLWHPKRNIILSKV